MYSSTNQNASSSNRTSFYLSMAQAAIKHSRDVLSRGPGNKIRRQSFDRTDPVTGAVLKHKSNTHERTLTNALVIQMLRSQRQNSRVISKEAHLWTQVGTGHCNEYCFVALDFLNKNNVTEIAGEMRVTLETELIYLQPPGAHVFVAIGSKRPDGVYSQHEIYGSSDIVICDPWANIACVGAEYLMRWQMKMNKWKMDQKELFEVEDNQEFYFCPTELSVNYPHLVVQLQP